MKRSKRYRKNEEKIGEINNISGAIDYFKEMEKVKFDESIEVHVKLNIDPKKTEQQVKFSLELPHGTGKSVKIAVFAEGDKAKEAEKAGADLVLGETDIQRIMDKKRKIDFQAAIAVPQMMPKLARIAKILGPKGLMPSPKNETVTQDVKKVVEEIKKGKMIIRNDSGGVVHLTIGKLSFKKEDLIENYKAFIENLEKKKSPKVKGRLIKRAFVATTMGPSIKVIG